MSQEYTYLRSEAQANEPLSVSAALSIAKTALESITLSIVGEISDLSDNPRYKAVYFTLADKGAALPCLMWRSSFDRLGIQLKSGMQVEVRGRFSLYSAKGRMQFDVRQLSLAGEGQLRAQVAALAAKLQSQGLMDEARKLPVPPLPHAIALVTSPRGKAVHDVLRTLRRRFPLVKVLLFGVGVEGKNAAADITEALTAAEQSEAETILLVRGGGSYEDLMPFNDEALAQRIASLKKPLITGIGHEPDTSIADMVASLRASTPTAAAEAATSDVQELISQIDALGKALNTSITHGVERSKHQLDFLEHAAVFAQEDYLLTEKLLDLERTAQRLELAIPTGLKTAEEKLRESEQRLQGRGETLMRDYTHQLQQSQARLSYAGGTLSAPYKATLAANAASLESLSPLAVLARGYALSYNQQGQLLRTPQQVKTGETIKVKLAEGSLQAEVVSKDERM